jgi:hypothetical protein
MNGFLVFTFAVAVRLWFIYAYPFILGGDTVLRMANRDRILLAYQLPLLQAGVFSVSRFFDGPEAIRWMMAIVGGIAAVGCYFVASHFLPNRAALLTALLFASNPFLVELSIVPYQEVLMLGALFFAFHYFFERRWLASSIALGLACLTRYEAWAACPVLIGAYVIQRGFRPAHVLKALITFGWAPALWIAWHAGISAPGTFVIEWPRSPARLMRFVYLGWISVKNTPVPVLVLAVFGAWTAWRTKLMNDARLRVLLAFFSLVVAAILFSAHGEAPDPERFVTAREASLWIVAVVVAAGLALRNTGRVWPVLAGIGVAAGLVHTDYVVRRDTSKPEIQVSYRLARYFESNLHEGERAVILTKPVPRELVRQYLDKILQRSGVDGLRNAQRVLATTETTPPDYQRTLVHSTLGRERVVSLAGRFGADPATISLPRCTSLAAVWQDFVPSNLVEARFYSQWIAPAPPTDELAVEDVRVRIYRFAPSLNCG